MTATIEIPQDHEHFTVWNHPEREWLLVKPTGIKQKWKPNELWWRSMVVAPNGTVLSAGLPKFRNYGEDLVQKDLFHKELSSGTPVTFTEKLDGSLAIRSVIDGEVIWRSRGSFGTEPTELHQNMRLLASEYPLLCDPQFMPDMSLHFEFCHPDHQIILEVTEPSLTLISGVKHDDLSLLTYNELENIAKATGVPLVTLHTLPTDVDNLLATVRAFKGSEGIVARYSGEQKYVKIKSAQYLAQHRLKSAFTPANAIELCQQFDFADGDAFMEHLYKLGFDWEVASEHVRWFEVYQQTCEQVDATMNDIAEFVHKNFELYETDRKAYAQLVTQTYADQNVRTPCFVIPSGKGNFDEARVALLKKQLEKVTPKNSVAQKERTL